MSMPRPTGMPRPTTKPTQRWPLAGKMAVRRLLPDADPFPEIQTYQQSNGPLWLGRMEYNSVWISTTGESAEHVEWKSQQFYMNETAKGVDQSEVVE